jgi:hypothetical protein
MPGITTEFLFKIALEVPVLALGETPYGERRVARFEGGSFEGPKLRGVVLPGAGGWMLGVTACSTLRFGLSSRPTTSK